MKDSIKNVFKGSYIFEWYYIVVIACYMATLFTSYARPGVMAAVLMCIIIVELLITKNMNIHSVMDVLIVVYFLYKAATIICIIRGDMPTSVYFGEAAVSLLPMIFYFAGKSKDKADDGQQTAGSGFYKKMLIGLCILGVISLVFYIVAPQFYCQYLYDWTYISKADASTMRVRMQSFTGSTVFGAIMVLGMAASASFLSVDNKNPNKEAAKKNRIFGVVTMFMTMFFAILSNQRSAMVVVALLLVYVLYMVFFKFGSIPKKNLIIGVIVAGVILLGICVLRFDFILKIWWRIESLPGAISQRSEQWVAAVNNMYSSWFGNGLGANGHKAIGVEGAHVIADGGLVKLYCEEGVIGFSLFIYILFLAIQNGIKSIEKRFAEIGIIVSALLMSIGSNVVAFQLVMPVFWYAVGRLGRNED